MKRFLSFNPLQPRSTATVAFILYLIFLFLLKLAFIFSGTDLFTEEAQYWLWSRYPDWSYYSKPPLIAWINYLTDVFPHSDRVIRSIALLFGASTLLIYYRLSYLVFASVHIARLSVIILSVSPYFVLASTFFTTDSLLIFFWVSSLYLLIIAIRHDNVNNWLLLGLSLGLGCLSKYAMFFILFVVIPLWCTKQKYVMRGLVLSLVVAFITFMPVIIWNYQHHWVTIKHVSGLAMPGNTVTIQDSIKYILEYCGGVVLISSPFLLLMFTDVKLRNAIFREININDKKLVTLLVVPMIGTLIVFFVVSLFKRTEVNWPSVTYSALPMVMAYGVDRAKMHIKALVYCAVTMVAVTLLLFPTSFDMLRMPELLPVRMDSMKRLAGWNYLANEIKTLQQGGVKNSWLLTDNYHVASELAFYTRQQNVACMNLGRRMNQFDIWSMNRADIPRSASALYVTESKTIDASVSFDSLIKHVVIPIHYRGQVIKQFHVYMLTNAQLKPASEFTAY